MIVNTFQPAYALGLAPRTLRSDNGVLTLLILRNIEASGPLTGLEAANAVAPIAHLLGIAPPGYALLHELTEAGLLHSPDGRQRRYSITDNGRREADRLAQECWPQLRDFVAGLKRRLAPASPRFGPEPRFVSEWSDGPAESPARRG
jgi:DNA-binding PadR family transcriptional regulator